MRMFDTRSLSQSFKSIVVWDLDCRESSLRLLLGNAMQGAAFLNEVEAVDGDDVAVREKFADDTESTVVIFGLVERWNQHGMVENEEIDV